MGIKTALRTMGFIIDQPIGLQMDPVGHSSNLKEDVDQG